MSNLATKYRTHPCGALRAADATKPVTLCGSVERRVDERAIELRDRSGKTRVVLPKNVSVELEAAWRKLDPNTVAKVEGTCIGRKEKEPALPTGEVEVVARVVTVLSSAEPYPPELTEGEPTLEARLRYRHLDLRRLEMQKRLEFRSRFIFEIRKLLVGEGFIEVETPCLTKWTPDATQSFVVPGRAGKVFALPGTPQQYKQVLMAGGVERYFQIARSFRREEELSAERQLEFTTLDVEMAYVDEEDVFAVVDRLVVHVFKAALDLDVRTPLPRVPYEEAMRRYASDAPDLRFGLEVTDLSLLASTLASKDLKGAGAIRAFRAPGAAEKLADAELGSICAKATARRPASAAWVKVAAGPKLRGSGARLFDAKDQEQLLQALPLEPGDAAVLVWSQARAPSLPAIGLARALVGRALTPPGPPSIAIVHRFPFFEPNAEGDAFVACRHPFSQPLDEDLPLIDTDKHSVRTKAYDIVVNGQELGAGSIRPHDLALQRKIFDMFEYKPEDVESRFGTVLDAFRFGVPPHGGFAIGLDRLIALLQGVAAIDDVIAFPKSRSGEDLLFGAPAPIDRGLLVAMLSED